MNLEFIEALKDLEKTKGISMDLLVDAIEQALVSAYKKNFGGVAQDVRAEINRETGDMSIFFQKEVVEQVTDAHTQISLEDARKYDEEFEVADVFESEVTPRSFGRIAAQTAKHVVIQRIREAERMMVYDQFVGRKDDMVNGIVTRVDNKNIYIDLGKTEALLLPSEQMACERYTPGSRMKFYVMDVKNTAKGPQVMLSRTHPGLLKRLFENEIPEINDGVLEIKAVVREAGQRAKIAISSRDENVDPVGACVGAKGMRVQSVVNELCGEKIEVIRWDASPASYIGNALSPATPVSVIVDDREKISQVVVPDMQLSLAIGREGQNARLAARLTGWKIDIKSESKMQELYDSYARENENNEDPEQEENTAEIMDAE